MQPLNVQRAGACLLTLALCLAGSVPPAAAEGPVKPGDAQASQPRLKVYAYTMKHHPADEALARIRPLLTSRGSVEVHPGSNTLVIREVPQALTGIALLLKDLDQPPQELRFDIQIVRAGPELGGSEPAGTKLAEEQVARLRELLRYDNYRVLAEAGVTAREGEEVTYSLGQIYSVSFRSGQMMAGQRVKLAGFRILKHVGNPANKGRQLEPRELFHANLNLWIGRPFSLVLAQDESRQEALIVAISWRRENDEQRAEGAPGKP